jgi:hypothetical protein
MAREPVIITIAPMGTLTKKTQCQENVLVRMPQRITPVVKPIAAIELNMPSALFLSPPSRKVVVIRDNAEGESRDAPSPCIALERKIRKADVARPPIKETREKTIRPIRNTVFRSKRSEALPPRSRKPTKVNA